MYSITLRHKGYSLKLSFKLKSYYKTTELEPGKTLYQILFEHLIDGKKFSCKDLVRKYKNVNPTIASSAIIYTIRKIEAAVKGSQDRRLMKKRFKVLQKEVALSYKGFSLNLVLKKDTFYKTKEVEPGKTLYQILFEHLIDGKTVSCKGLAREYKNVNASITARSIINVMKKIEAAVGGSQNSRLKEKHFKTLSRGGASNVLSRQSVNSRYTSRQREIIKETIKEKTKQGATPSYKRMRTDCLRALGEKGLAENVTLSNLTIWKIKKGLGRPVRPGPLRRPPKRRP